MPSLQERLAGFLGYHMTLIVVVAGATLLSLLLLLPLAIRVDRVVTPVARAVGSLPSRA